MNVIVFAPHEDDEAFACAGAMAVHVAAGDAVEIFFCTDGRLGTNPGIEGRYTPDELASVRQEEALAAASAVGIDASRVHFLGYHDQDLANPAHHEELISRIGSIVERLDPGIVYLAITNFGHVDHRAMYFSVFETLERLGWPGEVRVSIPFSFMGFMKAPSTPDVVEAFRHVNETFPVVSEIHVDYHEHLEKKKAAIRAHESQLGMFTNLVAPGDDIDKVLEEMFEDVYGDAKERFEVRKLSRG